MNSKERIQPPPSQQWWNQLVSKLNLLEEDEKDREKRRNELLALGVQLSGNGEVSFLNSDGVRVNCEFMRISFKLKVIAYYEGLKYGVPVIKFFKIPEIPDEVVTRLGHPHKKIWGTIEGI